MTLRNQLILAKRETVFTTEMPTPNQSSHRASPDQWGRLGRWDLSQEKAASSCILELRSRIEYLELTQRAHGQEWPAPQAGTFVPLAPVYSAEQVRPIIAPATLAVEGSFFYGGQRYEYKGTAYPAPDNDD